jgi:hypothetical protein
MGEGPVAGEPKGRDRDDLRIVRGDCAAGLGVLLQMRRAGERRIALVPILRGSHRFR